MNIIGLCGYARVGKDTAAMNMKGWNRWAFADSLKSDLSDLLADVGCDLTNSNHKEKARDLLVSYGKTMRLFRPDYWVRRLKIAIEMFPPKNSSIVITDVRYQNEIEAIRNMGGFVICINRIDYGPANEEEQLSFKHIFSFPNNPPVVLNNGTPEQLGKNTLKLWRNWRNTHET